MNTEPENLTDEDRAIGHIANNMIESVTFRQQIDIVRDFCFLKAEQFYKGLDDKEKKEIDEKVKEALKAQQESQPS
jgi:hypothetical protein|tara:strand:- start:566 stop:793 length:228 start_codon:yes stop_codon:yes gene_type:complete